MEEFSARSLLHFYLCYGTMPVRSTTNISGFGYRIMNFGAIQDSDGLSVLHQIQFRLIFEVSALSMVCVSHLIYMLLFCGLEILHGDQ